MHSASNNGLRNGFSKLGIVCIKIVCWLLNTSDNREILGVDLVEDWLSAMILAEREICVYNLEVLTFKRTIYYVRVH